jgi:OOP family OmpA-OmpF porin
MKQTLLALALVSGALCTLPVLAQQTEPSAQPAIGMDNTSSMAPADSGLATPPTTDHGAADGNYLPTQPVGSGNWFIDGRIGQAHINKGPYRDHPTTYAIDGGYRWKVGPDVGLGVDIGYNDLGNFRVKNALYSNSVNQTSRRNALRGWTAGVNGHINVWRGLYISGRTGIYGWKGHGYSNQDINRHDLNKVDYYAGAGVGYDFTNHFGLGLSYDYYHASKSGINLSTDAASLNAEYRF